MQRVSSFLSAVLRKRGLLEHAEAAHVVHKATAWIRDHHPDLASSLSVRSLKDGELLVECVHGVVQQEMQCASAELAQHLQRDCGLRSVRIRVVRGS